MINRHRTFWRRAKYPGLLLYILLLIASHFFQSINDDAREIRFKSDPAPHVVLRADEQSDSSIRVIYKEWIPKDTQNLSTPVLLLHGSPGNGGNFDSLAPLIQRTGRRVIAPDLPGSGMSDWAPDMSYRSQAKYMEQLLNEVNVDRVHIVGWSSGGGVALEMAHQSPHRVASITLLASVGAQKTEGSGSYFFEHVKYAVGVAGLGVGPELIPHFGTLGTFKSRAGWLKAFWDSDQRELTRIMPTIETPVLILHGRDDPLVAACGAEWHHEMMPTSRLIMLDASHFLPFMQAEETAGYLNEFFDRHDEPGIEPQTGVLDLAPARVRYGADALLHWIGYLVHEIPWWLQLIVLILLTRYLPHVTIVLTAIMVVMMEIDLAIAILALLIGRTWWLTRGANTLERPIGKLRWMRGVLFVVPAILAGMIVGQWAVHLSERAGFFGLLLGVILTLGTIHGIRLIITWSGRQRIKGWFRRATNHEYWPRVLIYIPVLSWGFMRMLRKGLQPLTAVNPGYAHDGGVQDESKMDLNHKLGDGDDPIDAVLHCVLVDEVSAEQRTAAALRAIESDPQLNGFPIIAKPDKGERGRAVKLLKDADDLREYCQNCSEPFVLQRFHPGPHEIGVLWMRRTESITDPESDGQIGFIYAITIKHFPTLRGDGKRPLRRLILSHKRHRAQPGVFFEYNKSRLDWVPQESEKVILGIAGNHAQGAKFTDGSHLITPQLTDRMNEIVTGFDERAGRGFDIGRFDLRCESLEELKNGRGFGIVELNGLTSEPTNLYDPKRSLFWAWGMLLGYWKHLERLAEARIETKTGEPVDDHTWDRIRNALIRAMI